MGAGSGRSSVIPLIIAVLSLSASAALTAVVVRDYTVRDIVPSGVAIDGADASGSGISEARALVDSRVSMTVLSTLPVKADGRSYTFDPAGAVSIDREGMVAAALSPRHDAPLLKRLALDTGLVTTSLDVAPAFSVDADAIGEWVADIAKQVDRPAKDASLTVSSSLVTITPEVEGRSLDTSSAVRLISAAIEGRSGDTSMTDVEIPVASLEPSVTADDFGKTIVVDLSERRIRLFDGAALEKAYRCAIGAPGHSTPKGAFEIVEKRYMPTWRNPGSAWAVDMPASIPPGPSNPLGTRALNLNAPGIRIHGTTKISSIGTAASHGCMRMVRRDVEDLYERVDVGTKVFIVP